MPLPIALLLPAAPAVTLASLLRETWDFHHLTGPAKTAYVAAQASSYDRASDPGPNQDWFANGDAGRFLRSYRSGNRTEYVMADLKGPGAVVRVWSANPTGTLRFYFDGEPQPRLEARTSDLLDGKDPRFPAPFAYAASEGHNLYFPLPYAKSLIITVDDSDGPDRPSGFYYHVGYRSYALGSRVESLSNVSLNLAKRAITVAADHLTEGAGKTLGPRKDLRIEPGKTVTLFQRPGAGTVEQFEVEIPFPLKQTLVKMDWSDPAQPHQVLRNLLLRVVTDGKTTVDAPLGDFFATAPRLADFRTLPFEVKGNRMVCRLPMPFGKGLRVTLENVGTESIPLRAGIQISEETAPFRLHAQWSANYGPSQPKVDLNFMDARGKGYFVGSHLHVENSLQAWWGEGDEKVYVDGEPFPSTFGTGTEDYYGYAWCSPKLFTQPYHAQPICDGPGNFGHTSVLRFHVLDPIPFRSSLRFDMERWHWEACEAGFSRVAYWYAAPGGTLPRPVDRKRLAVHELLPPRMKGVLEGEDLAVVSRTGGELTVQRGFAQTSNWAQLWWSRPEEGERLVIQVPVTQAGRYEVVANLCHASDYGRHEIRLGGKVLGTWDFFNPELRWKPVSLGVVELPAGTHELEVVSRGRNRAAAPGNMFGLDYLQLKKLP